LELAATEKEKERQFELQKADREKQAEEKKLQLELRKKGEEREFERLRLAAENKQREFEEAKLAREREQARIAADRAEQLERIRYANEMEKMHVEFRLSVEAKKTTSKDHRNAESGHSGTGFIKAPKMPYFDEDKDFMDSYLNLSSSLTHHRDGTRPHGRCAFPHYCVAEPLTSTR